VLRSPDGVLNAVNLRRVLKCMLDENEFLSSFDIRALSRFHQDHAYVDRAPARASECAEQAQSGSPCTCVTQLQQWIETHIQRRGYGHGAF